MVEPKTKFARDQTGAPWIVYLHNGEWWAMGVGEDDLPTVNQVFDDEVMAPFGERQHLYRQLKYIQEL